MAEQENILHHLSEIFDAREANLNGHAGSTLHDFQKSSFDALKRVQFPDRKHEDWKYTPVQRLITPGYTVASHHPIVTFHPIPNLDSYIISIVNGQVDYKDLDPGLLETGVTIMSLKDAFENPLWKEAFETWVSPAVLTSNRAFEFLNYSFQSDGMFIHIPSNTKVEKPIELRIVHEDAATTFSHPLYFIRCGSGSEVSVIERFEINEDSKHVQTESLINSLGYVHIEKNATLRHIKWQNLPQTQHLVYKLFVSQFRDSRFETLAFDHGGHLVRNNIEVELEESNTYTSLQAGYLASGKQSMDHQTRINHKVPHCESHELYKGILDDQASAAFNGKVFVHKDAQKTNAYQQNDTIVLSPHAVMNSKPQLEIYADDVKCSHGATIGQMDERAVFYLRSRGLDKETATHMLKKAFLEEVLQKIPDEAVREYISSQMTLGS